MKQLQKFSKFLSDYTSIVVIAIAVITFFLPSLMGWVNFQLFTDQWQINSLASLSLSVSSCSAWAYSYNRGFQDSCTKTI